MSTAMTEKPKSNLWTSWIAIAVVAILAGILLPQLFSGEMALEKSAAKTEAKSKSSLEYAAPTLPDVPNPQAMFVRLGVGTMAVLGMCVLTLWGMRRWMNPQAAAGALSRDMKLMETLQLGNRCCVHLVHLGKQQVLIGADATGIKTIVPLPSAFDEVLTEAQMDVPPAETVTFPKIAA